MKIYAGIDIGSCTTKAVVIDEDANIIGSHVRRSGIDYKTVARESLDIALGGRGIDGVPIVATGYGRHNVSLATQAKTEIACHAKGAFHYVPRALTVVDIGGQDNKVIKLNEKGQTIDFKMNRKCAAGTGTFIEEIAIKTAIPLDKLDELARKSQKRVKIGSYCTVFASTEILSLIRSGVAAEDLARGVFESVVARIIEMIPSRILSSLWRGRCLFPHCRRYFQGAGCRRGNCAPLSPVDRRFWRGSICQRSS